MQEHKTRLVLEPAIWRLIEQLRCVLNAQLKAMDRPELSTSATIALIVKKAILENHADVQDEYERLGLDRLALQLAPLLGADGLAAAGLPEVPDGDGARRLPRNARTF